MLITIAPQATCCYATFVNVVSFVQINLQRTGISLKSVWTSQWVLSTEYFFTDKFALKDGLNFDLDSRRLHRQKY